MGYSVVRRSSRSLLIHPLIPGDELHQQHPPNHIPLPPHFSRLDYFPPSSSSSCRCSGNLRFTPRAKSRRSPHSIFVVSPLKQKSASHWRVRVRDVFWRVLEHTRSVLSLYLYPQRCRVNQQPKIYPPKRFSSASKTKSFKWVTKHPLKDIFP